MIYGTAVMFIYYVFWLFSTLCGKYPGCSLGRALGPARNKCRLETRRKLLTIFTTLYKGSNSFCMYRKLITYPKIWWWSGLISQSGGRIMSPHWQSTYPSRTHPLNSHISKLLSTAELSRPIELNIRIPFKIRKRSWSALNLQLWVLSIMATCCNLDLLHDCCPSITVLKFIEQSLQNLRNTNPYRE